MLIAGPGFPVDAEGNPGIDFEFNIFPGQTPQSIADQLRNEIVSRLGEAAQETVDVRIETGEGGELLLVLQSSAGAITTDIDFESIIQGQPGTQNINTVALPDEGELSEGDTLELTLTGLPGAGEVNLSQTLDAGETLLDAAQSLVADIATLTGSEGEPLGLSGEIVTVTTGAPGTGDPEVTAIQITSPSGFSLGSVEFSVGSEVDVQNSIVQTEESFTTLEIPSDIGDLSQSVQLEFTLESAGFGGPIDFALTINPGQSPQDVAEQMSQQIRSGPHPELVAFVQTEVRSDPETGDVSLVLQPLGISPFTVDVDFESIVPGQPGTQNVNIVPLPHEIAEGDTLELTLTGLPGAGASQTVDPGKVLSDVAADLVADIAALTGDQGELLGLTAEVLPSADPTQNEHSVTITIPSDVGDLSEPTQLNVSAAGTFAPGGAVSRLILAIRLSKSLSSWGLNYKYHPSTQDFLFRLSRM